MAKTTSERVHNHASRMKEDGLKKATIWIPDNDEAIESIKRSAKRLRKKYGTLLPTER